MYRSVDAEIAWIKDFENTITVKFKKKLTQSAVFPTTLSPKKVYFVLFVTDKAKEKSFVKSSPTDKVQKEAKVKNMVLKFNGLTTSVIRVDEDKLELNDLNEVSLSL